ncbi:MAG: NAD-dependent epimerase/dehydratase family protein [Bacteroidales bacterium]
MNIAITGATGFLGRYLVAKCLETPGLNVKVIARPQENPHASFLDQVEIFESDYSTESLQNALNGVDCVLHLAAKTLARNDDPLQVSNFLPANVILTENLLKAASVTSVNKVIQMSSSNVYSANNQLPFKESEEPKTSTVYGLSKIFSEQVGLFFARKTNMNIISLRLARLYGFGERDSVVFTRFMKMAMNKQPLVVFGEGSTRIEYLYVKDCVDAILKTMFCDIPSGVYNLGSSESYSVLELAKIINKTCGNDGNIKFDFSTPETGHDILMDSSLFRKYCLWEKRWMLEPAIKDMYSLFLNAKNTDGNHN